MCKTKCKFFYIVVNAKKFPVYNLFYTIHKKSETIFSNISKKDNDFYTQQKLSAIPYMKRNDEVIFILRGFNGEYKLWGLFRDGVKFTSKCVNFTSKVQKFTSKRVFHSFF